MASIYSRQKNEEGKWRYKRVNTGPGRRPVNLAGPFYLRTTSGWLHAGDTLEEAQEESETHEAQKSRAALGLVGAPNNLRVKIDAFVAETEANKARKTWLAYKNTMRYFQRSCRKRNIEDITREDLLAFKMHLRNEKLSERSIYNNFLYAMIFLKWCGVKPGVKKNDWPPCPEREPEEYTEQEIKALLEAAYSHVDSMERKLQSPKHQVSQTDERLLLNCFLCSALRHGEMAHLTYGDVDFQHSVWTVQPKEDWKTKTQGSQRDVPVPPWLTKKIYKRMIDGKHQKSDLIFPSMNGKPDRWLLKVVKRVAIRAGLLKVVKHENGKTALVGMRVDDHKFRATAITRWLRDGVAPQDVMAWVGHKKLDTILRYAAKVNVRKAETLKKAARTFAAFANVGD